MSTTLFSEPIFGVAAIVVAIPIVGGVAYLWYTGAFDAAPTTDNKVQLNKDTNQPVKGVPGSKDDHITETAMMKNVVVYNQRDKALSGEHPTFKLDENVPNAQKMKQVQMYYQGADVRNVVDPLRPRSYWGMRNITPSTGTNYKFANKF